MNATWVALLRSALVTIGAAILARVIAAEHAATVVGFAFLGATYWFALKGKTDEAAREHGLSLGGLLEDEPLRWRRLLRSLLGTLAWALLLCTIAFPPFWIGYSLWYHPTQAFAPALPPALLDEGLGQVLVIALPEEAFYRGYAQTALDRVWPPRWSVLGARLGPGWLVASALFAVGHVLAEPNPARLAVFFPGLVFGWLRARTRSIGPGVAFHAACNLFASFLGYSYGFLE